MLSLELYCAYLETRKGQCLFHFPVVHMVPCTAMTLSKCPRNCHKIDTVLSNVKSHHQALKTEDAFKKSIKKGN